MRFDNIKYLVSASAVGRPIEIRAYADRVVIRQDGRIVAGSATAPFEQPQTCRGFPATTA